MSDVDNEFENDDVDEAPKPSKGNALRDQNSKLAAENTELKDRLAKLEAKERAGTIAEVLREKGANPKLAKYVTRDIEGDVTADAVAKWLEDEGELFGYQPGGSDDEDDEVAEQQERVSQASARATQPQTGMTPEKMRSMSFDQMVEAGLLEPL